MSVKIYSLDEIIDYARKHSKYYADLYRDVPEDAPFEELPLVDQNDFWAHCDERGGTVATRQQRDGQIFKSGGTTGNPKYSLYSAQEWETLCEYSGTMLTKGGLTNGTKIANLFYAGGMYASFLYTYSMLYSAPAKTIMYNLSGNGSIEEIVTALLEHQITCIAGVPSIMTRIVSYINENHLTGFAVDTVYFAGETLYQDQRDQFCEAFGRDLEFRSVFYSSNDGGAIGYFTKDCGFNEHRVLSDLCKVEIIDPDTGEVIHEMNRPGNIYITSLFKTLIPLIRYPAGDVGEYTEPEGNTDRKFKILGRSNVAARASYVSLYPKDVGNVLEKCGIEYYAYQIVVTHDIQDQFIFRIAVPKAEEDYTEKFLEMLYQERSFLKDALNDGTLKAPEVDWCRAEDLEYNARTGKLKPVLDQRM
ncbi:MAG: hypothetical protein K2P35_12105 [Lachnospiraceae bacterium]|nr:hypothetical protein [Lachnospiraceae bacterium]